MDVVAQADVPPNMRAINAPPITWKPGTAAQAVTHLRILFQRNPLLSGRGGDGAYSCNRPVDEAG